LPSWKVSFRASRNFPRTIRERALTGTRKEFFCGDPAIGREVESPAGDHEMEMGMELQILIPGMQDHGFLPGERF